MQGGHFPEATTNPGPTGLERIFLDHALLPEGWAQDVLIEVADGFIHSIAAGSKPSSARRLKGIGLPGLPNVHSYAFQRAMAGLAETRGPDHDNFWTWREAMYRMLAVWTPDDVEAIAAFSQMEMLERGFTAVAEFHYLHHDESGAPYADLSEMSQRIVAAAETSAIGLTLLPCFYHHGGFGGLPPEAGQRRFINDPQQFIALFEAATGAVAVLPDAAIGVAPHSLRAVTPESLREVLASVPSGPIHIHAAEQQREVDDCASWSGVRPVEWLLDHADIGPRWCIIHATHMLPQETERLARSGAVAGLCPITEANLGDGVFDGVRFIAYGGRFALGTDSNILIDSPGEIRQLEYSQRLTNRLRNVLASGFGVSTGRFLYERAASGGAQAAGRKVGALREGLRADFVVLNPDHPNLSATSGDLWLDAYVFTAGSNALDSVVCGGKLVVENGVHIRRKQIATQYKRSLRKLVDA